MNKQDYDILKLLNENNKISQRIMARTLKYSLGNINNTINNLNELKYLNKDNRLTKKSKILLEENKPKSAIILAAGIGVKMLPINYKFPKGLLKVNDECLIERLIKQLKEVGINNICIVVGYLKEKYEYLIDKYDVDLIVNSK